MSDPDEEDTGADDQPKGGDAEGADDPEEQPDIDDEDLVDVSPEMAEQVAQETTSNDDQAEGGDGDGDDGGDDTSDDGGESSPLTTGTSVGDIYCNALGMSAAVARDRRGSGVDDCEQAVDEYADMARQLELDQFVDEWVEAHSGVDELSPGQGIVVGTMMFSMMVMVEDPELVDGLAEEVPGA